MSLELAKVGFKVSIFQPYSSKYVI